ncbi:MAG: EamA family transporter [Candidatus Kariarchaeaceae archaeon]
MVEFVTVAIAVVGSLFFGLTAVILKIGTENQNVYYSLLIRAGASVPILFAINIYRDGIDFFEPFLENKVLILIILSSATLLLGDILLMYILKTKPVGVITPIIATNPFFATMLLLLFGEEGITMKIIILTLTIILGVFFVTYQKPNNNRANGKIIDRDALVFGLLISFTWGIMLFLDIQILKDDKIDGFAFSGVKIIIVGLFSTILVIITTLKNDKAETKLLNRRSVKYMLLAGITGWVLGVILVYSAFNIGPAAIINPIVGLNPLFAAIFSIMLRLEGINRVKSFGISLCVISSIMLVV